MLNNCLSQHTIIKKIRHGGYTVNASGSGEVWVGFGHHSLWLGLGSHRNTWHDPYSSGSNKSRPWALTLWILNQVVTHGKKNKNISFSRVWMLWSVMCGVAHISAWFDFDEWPTYLSDRITHTVTWEACNTRLNTGRQKLTCCVCEDTHWSYIW